MRSSQRPAIGAGLMVVLFVFVSLTAAFMGGVAMRPETDTANRTIAILIFVPLTLWAVAFLFGLRRAVLGRWLSARRWRRMRPKLEAAGFRDATAAEIDGTSRLPVHILLPEVLAQHRGGGIDHVMVGEVGGQEARCFNVRMRGGGWTDVPAVAVRADASFAPTLLYRAGRLRVAPRPGMKRVSFELGRFNRSFAVYSTDAFFASALLDARMIDWLSTERRRAFVELSDHWVVASSAPMLLRRPGPVDLLDLLVRFDEHIPRVVPSLFPHRTERLLWPSRAR